MPKEYYMLKAEELDRVTLIKQVIEKRLKQKEVATRLNLSKRQVIRLAKGYRTKGVSALTSSRRGKPSNHKHSDEFKDSIKKLIGSLYSDFGPTFAAEKLKERHGLAINKETLRQWMLEWGFWEAKRHKKIRCHPSRERRPCFGELVQIDGSHHAWFEKRGEKCCLLVFIDDATSRLLGLRFEEEETTLGYFRLVRESLEKHGIPLAYYSDKACIFRTNIRDRANVETQWGRAMRQLNVEIICANSPQAKGRVERANRTLQDRLIKEMRLRGINNIEMANNYLPEFIEKWNKEFTVEPSNKKDVHRKTLPSKDILNSILSIQATRKLSKNLEVRHENIIYQLNNEERSGYHLRFAMITVCEEMSGKITLLYKGKRLPYTTFGNRGCTPQVIESKQLEKKLSTIKRKASKSNPWRQYEQEPTRLSKG